MKRKLSILENANVQGTICYIGRFVNGEEEVILHEELKDYEIIEGKHLIMEDN